jgi:hypothetical protein
MVFIFYTHFFFLSFLFSSPCPCPGFAFSVSSFSFFSVSCFLCPTALCFCLLHFTLSLVMRVLMSTIFKRARSCQHACVLSTFFLAHLKGQPFWTNNKYNKKHAPSSFIHHHYHYHYHSTFLDALLLATR